MSAEGSDCDVRAELQSIQQLLVQLQLELAARAKRDQDEIDRRETEEAFECIWALPINQPLLLDDWIASVDKAIEATSETFVMDRIRSKLGHECQRRSDILVSWNNKGWTELKRVLDLILAPKAARDLVEAQIYDRSRYAKMAIKDVPVAALGDLARIKLDRPIREAIIAVLPDDVANHIRVAEPADARTAIHTLNKLVMPAHHDATHWANFAKADTRLLPTPSSAASSTINRARDSDAPKLSRAQKTTIRRRAELQARDAEIDCLRKTLDAGAATAGPAVHLAVGAHISPAATRPFAPSSQGGQAAGGRRAGRHSSTRHH